MNKLLNQQLDELFANSPIANTKLGLEGVLRVGAGTLSRAAHGEITATTVVCDVRGADVEEFECLVQDIADEFGLDVRIQQQPCSWSVRFTRRHPAFIPIETGRADKSVLALLFRL
jgi:hypothetical protein